MEEDGERCKRRQLRKDHGLYERGKFLIIKMGEGEREGVQSRGGVEEEMSDVRENQVCMEGYEWYACACSQGREAPNADAVNLPLLLLW